MSIEELKAQMALAVKTFNETGDMTKIQEVSNAMNKQKVEIARANADKLLKENEALAGNREMLAKSLHRVIAGSVTCKNDTEAIELVKQLSGDIQSLPAMKAWGFTYKVDKANPSEPDVVYKTVSLSTAVVKVRKAGGGGGAVGKSKDEYGLSLQEIVDKFATDDEKVAITGAETNSKSWQLKVAVKKAAIAAGKLAPVK